MVSHQKQILVIMVLCIVVFAAAGTLQAQTFDRLNVYVWNFTTRDYQETESTEQLTRDFEDALLEKMQKGGCFQKVLSRRAIDRLLEQKEQEKSIMSIEGVTSQNLETLKMKDANAVIFGEVYADPDGTLKVTVFVQTFDAEILAIQSHQFLQGEAGLSAKRAEHMQTLVAQVCEMRQAKPSPENIIPTATPEATSTPTPEPTSTVTPPPISSIYTVTVHTGDIKNAGTDANVYITLYGLRGQSAKTPLYTNNYNDFEQGLVTSYDVNTDDLGELDHIVIEHDNTGGDKPGWFLEKVHVKNTNPASKKEWDFPCRKWLARTAEDGKISRIIYPIGHSMYPKGHCE